MTRQQLVTKYGHYLRQGHLVLSVTLSTYIKSSTYAGSDSTRQMWDHHFIGRFRRRLPYKLRDKLDYDYVMEQSPEGFWHYHGLLAVPASSAAYLLKNNSLHPRLARDFESFSRIGSQRPFRINSFLIEPVKNIDAWSRYITKGQPFERD